MGNNTSAEAEAKPLKMKIKEVRRHVRLVSKIWNKDDFLIHRQQARLLIDVIKEMRKFLRTNEFPESSIRILIEIYKLLDRLYWALMELKSLQDFWDFRPNMVQGLLPCAADLADLGVWARRLDTNFELRIYPVSKGHRVNIDDPQADIIRDIIGGSEVTKKVGFSSLEFLGHFILPYLSRRDREDMMQKMMMNVNIRGNTLVAKKKEFLQNILEGAADEHGHGLPLPRLQVVDGAELSRPCLVGSGSYGNVYRVEWLGSPCALKQLEYDEKDWMEEAQILSKLRHPNIVQVFGCAQRRSSQNHHGILMELLGSSLHDIIFRRDAPARKHFTNMVALDIMLQIARAMEYLHSRNIIHRDLKPGNVLAVAAPDPRKRDVIPVTDVESLRVKVADFGLAKVKEKGWNTESLTSKQGSGRYRAPEVLQGGDDTRYNVSADVYSFAITSFEILTGDEGNKKEISISTTDDFLEKMKTHLLRECCDSTPQNRPSFGDICRRLEKIQHELAISDKTQSL